MRLRRRVAAALLTFRSAAEPAGTSHSAENESVLRLATSIASQMQGAGPVWTAERFEFAVERAVLLVQDERSPRTLGEILRLDEDLSMPVLLIIAVYGRLFELGVNDVHTRLCFARYLGMHGPDWDDEANGILHEISDAARDAGLWEGTHLGHHPVFFAD